MLIKQIAEKYQLELLILIGSYGTDDFKSGESDIDIAYLTENPLSVNDKLAFLNDISQFYQYSKIDLIDLQKAAGLLKYKVAIEGRPIYEQYAGQFDRYYLYCLRYYYDTEKFRKLRSKYLEEQLEALRRD
ncbi:putative nucleotidyltransferase [Desulfitispora alkaliphila]|uniref:type VII toxin-antitoxin system MntA family adenylyltransferase antitoxin n=1 Tax=Desulfitispora alkaliphila TaxID=622674 RepID=UPI003D1A7248